MREKITSFIFVIVLVFFFALVMIIPKDEKASVQENRPLAEMPIATPSSVFSGEFGSAYETYLTDNVGFRSSFVRLGTIIEDSRGIKSKTTGKIVTLTNGSQLALKDGKIMEIFKKNPESMQQYIDVLNSYSEKFSKDINMYVMLAPTQIEFDESEYGELADSEKEVIDTVYASLNNFKTADAYSKLSKHTDEYIYFRTDHHWTQRGAYYGYQAIMEAKGSQPVDIDSMKVNKLNGFLGYLYNQANVPEYAEYADEIEYFDFGENYLINAKIKEESGQISPYQSRIYMPPTGDAAPTYGIFMGADHPFAEINTNVKNGQTVLVIKDSYANALLPLLTNNYERILVVDPRNFYGTVTELTEEYQIDDIIFVNYVFTTSLPGFVEFIKNIL